MTSLPAPDPVSSSVESPAEAAERARREETLAGIEWRLLEARPEQARLVARIARERGEAYAAVRAASASVESALTAAAGPGGGARQRVAMLLAVLSVLGGVCAIAGPLADDDGRGWGLVLAVVSVLVSLAAGVAIVAANLSAAIALVGGAMRLSLPFVAGVGAVLGACALVGQLGGGALDAEGATPFVVLGTALLALAVLGLGVVDLVRVRAFTREFRPMADRLMAGGATEAGIRDALDDVADSLSEEELDAVLEARRSALGEAVAAGAIAPEAAVAWERAPLGMWALLRPPRA